MNMWHIREHRSVEKACRKLPVPVLKKYELWKNIVYRHGPAKLREFPGFHEEALKGQRAGQRSSRLDIRFRVIYTVENTTVTVYVLEISPHEY